MVWYPTIAKKESKCQRCKKEIFIGDDIALHMSGYKHWDVSHLKCDIKHVKKIIKQYKEFEVPEVIMEDLQETLNKLQGINVVKARELK